MESKDDNQNENVSGEKYVWYFEFIKEIDKNREYK